MTLTDYLLQRHTASTAKRYYSDILKYLKTITQEQADTAKYSDIMDYIGVLRKKYSNPETIKCNLYAIKKYYYWLNYTGQRKNHPCRNLLLRDKTNRDIQLQDLFTQQELELLMERKERYKNVKIKNQVIMSLLIYQGLTRSDITELRVKNINLEEGNIYIKATHKTNSRTLQLKAIQIMLFNKYINEIRLKLKTVETDILILTKTGTPEKGEGIGYLLETSKYLFPERNLNTKTIRQSVIANYLKQGIDLRLVQVFAGHKYLGSTEKYRQTGIEELRIGIQKYHPLK